MKKLLFSLAALLLLATATNSANAQDLYSRRLSIGPVFTGGMHIMAGEVPTGYKIKPRFGFSFGAFGEIDVSNLVSVDLGLTYLSRTRYFHLEDDEDVNTTLDVSYLAITPMASFKGFLLGFGINLPMSGTSITKLPGADVNADIESSDLKTVIDFKIGGNIPIIKTDGGDLSFLVLGAYDLTKPFRDTNGSEEDFASPDASLHLGLTYQFNVSTLK